MQSKAFMSSLSRKKDCMKDFTVFNSKVWAGALQLAVGPVCIAAFNASAMYGLLPAAAFVIAVTLTDAAFIALACAGAAAIINKIKIKKIIKAVGSAILVLFGLYIILSALQSSNASTADLFKDISARSLFAQGFILTAANPLTIIFWGGVFSSQIINDKLNKKQMLIFGIGCVLSTLIALTCVSVLGSVAGKYLPGGVIKMLNICAGVVIIIFGIQFLYKKEPDPL